MRRYSSALLCVIAIARTGAAAPPGQSGQFLEMERLQATLATVAEAVSPTVVAIRAQRRLTPAEFEARNDSQSMPNDEAHRPFIREQKYPAVGTGVILDAAGGILTNEHVIEGAAPEDIMCTLSTGEQYRVRSVISDHRSDLAVVRVDAADLPAARLGDVSNVKQGHFAIVLGNPYGSASEVRGRPSMSFGVVSALGRQLTQQLVTNQNDDRYYGNLIQTDARINPGNSGGPMLNIRGEVIGIVTATSTRSGASEGLGYAIPIDGRVKSIIQQLLRGEEVEYGYLGVQLRDATEEDRQAAGAPSGTRGAVIEMVHSGQPAELAHLQPGDLVVEFDRLPVQSDDELIRAVGAARVGSTVKVVFFRGGERCSVDVTTTRRRIDGEIDIDTPFRWRGLTLMDAKPGSRPEDASVSRGVIITELADGVIFKHIEGHEDVDIDEGAVVQKVNDSPVLNVRDFRRKVASLQDMVTLTLLSKGQSVEVAVPAESGE